MTISRRYTVADLEAFPDDDGNRYEVIDGVLFVSTAPHGRHQMALDELIIELGTWNRRTRLGQLISGAGVIFAPDSGVIPDLIWVRKERLQLLWRDDGHLYAAPDLVVEILSPGAENHRRDLDTKLGLYSRYGVEEYWILSWIARTVQIYRRGTSGRLELVETLDESDQLTSPLLPGFSMTVGDLFSFPAF